MIPDNLMDYYRILALDEKEIKDQNLLAKLEVNPRQALSEENETRAKKLLGNRLKEILKGYHDLDKLNPTSYVQKMICQLKQGEKEILQSCLQLLGNDQKEL